MRVVTNEKIIDRNKRNAQILFFVSMALLIGGFFFGGRLTSDEQLAATIQLILIPVLLVMVITSVRMTNKWVRQPHPWLAIQKGLKGLGGDTTLYNFLMPADHVIVNDTGVYAITTRFQDRPQKVVDDKWKGRGGLLTMMRQEGIGNPTKEAKLNAKQTEVFLQELLQEPDIEVQPLIVFVHPEVKVEMEGEQSVPVLYAYSEKSTNAERKDHLLKKYLQNEKKAHDGDPPLSDEKREELDDVLLYEE